MAKPSTAHAPVAIVTNNNSDITRRKTDGFGKAGGARDVSSPLSS